MTAAAARPRRARLALLAFGDFAFNLYWQSVMLYLLFYYTDALGLPIAAAATTYLVASIWDGIASFGAGVLFDRVRWAGGHARIVLIGAVPLGLSFVLAYAPPQLGGGWDVALVFGTHLLFRTAYAATNVPYLALSAQVSSDSRDRSFLAGVRMLFGTLAVIFVAIGTVPLGTRIAGVAHAADAYLGAAMLFALIGTAILVQVGSSFRGDPEQPDAGPRPPVLKSVAALFANRAFVTLNLAMMAMIVAVTVLNKSVLYYFKYFLDDDAGGQLALASMGVVSAIAVPAWMLLSRPFGTRTLWFLAAGASMAMLLVFAAWDVHRAGAMQLFLMAMQGATVGLHFAFWAMLPNTIEYGQHETGLRTEGTVFGLAALLQRIAIGIATAILGWSFGSAGYVANVTQSTATLEAMRWTIIAVPFAFLALSCGFMRLNPLGKGAHARIVRDLAERQGG